MARKEKFFWTKNRRTKKKINNNISVEESTQPIKENNQERSTTDIVTSFGSNLIESKQDENNFRSWFGDELADRYIAIRQKLKAPENNYYYWKDKPKKELRSFLKNAENTESHNQEKARIKREGAECIYNKDGWKIYRIDTQEAAALYGENTTWCITGRYPGHESEGKKWFNYYKKNGADGYYFIFSPTGEKWAYLDYPKPRDFYHSSLLYNSDQTTFFNSAVTKEILNGIIPEDVLAHLPHFENAKYFTNERPYEKDKNIQLIYEEDEYKIYSITYMGLKTECPTVFNKLEGYITFDLTYIITYEAENFDDEIFFYLPQNIGEPYAYGGKLFEFKPDKLKTMLYYINYYWGGDNIAKVLPLSIMHHLPLLTDFKPYTTEDNTETIFKDADWVVYKVNHRAINMEFHEDSWWISSQRKKILGIYIIQNIEKKNYWCYLDFGDPKAFNSQRGIFRGIPEGKSYPEEYSYLELNKVEESIPAYVISKLPGLGDYAVGSEESTLKEIYTKDGWTIYTGQLKDVVSCLNSSGDQLRRKNLPSNIKNYYLMSDGVNWYTYFDCGAKHPSSKTAILYRDEAGLQTIEYRYLDLDIFLDLVVDLGIPTNILKHVPGLNQLSAIVTIQKQADIAEEKLDNGTLYYTEEKEMNNIIDQTRYFIKKIIISNNVTTLSAYLFANLPVLKEVEFEPESKISEIPNGCFERDQRLSSITIPKSVETIKQDAFGGDPELTTLIIEDGDNPLSIDGWEPFYHTAPQNFTLPARLTSLGDAHDYALWGFDKSVENINVRGEYRPELFKGQHLMYPITITWVDDKGGRVTHLSGTYTR